MKTLRRLRRHLSYANVMATIAVFVALGGVSYAAATISGNKLIKGTVGAGKLKNGTLTSTQVRANSLTGSVIDESTLTIVPAAQTANSATTATSATTAGRAAADTATKATEATSAESALTAENADTVAGFSAEELKVACPPATKLFGGMCWDEDVQPGKNWIAASRACGDADGRLPSLSELVAYVLGNSQVDGETWTGEVSGLGPGNEELVFTRAEASSATAGALTTPLGYRCLFYRVN